MEERITSRKNPLIQHVRKLFSSRSYRYETGCFAADGTKLLAEAVRNWPGLETVILTDGVQAEVPPHVRIVRVPEDVMESVSPMASPQGAVFVCRMRERQDFSAKPGCLLLDGIQDPGNIGTILRTADAFNVPVVLLEGCADPFGHKVVRASMGAVFRMPVYSASWEQVRQDFAQAGIPVAATALTQKAEDIRNADVSRMAVVIGSEGQGVRDEILNSVDHSLIIPMNSHCESLNAAIAASVVMWQMACVL